MADSRRAAEDAAAEEEAEAAAAERAAISFAAADAPVAATTAAADAAAAPTSVAASLAELEAERALHRRRAERFGGEFVDPVRSFFRSSRDERVVFTAASARGPTARRRRRRSRDGPSSPLAPPLPPLRPRFSLPRPSAARKTREAAPLAELLLQKENRDSPFSLPKSKRPPTKKQAKKAGPLRDAERRARLERKDGFVTGIDLFADEERVRDWRRWWWSGCCCCFC